MILRSADVFGLDCVREYLGEALVEPIDVLDGLWIRKREHLWPYPDNVSILFVKCNVRMLCLSLVDVPESLPIGQAC